MAKRTVARRRADWTADELRDWLDYHPDTGEFWTRPRKIGRVCDFGKTRVPAVVLSLKAKDGVWRNYYAHRLAWLWMTGEWPHDEIDHINNDSTDNRWDNLREASHIENNRNKDFRSGRKLLGAHFHRGSGLWQATLRRKTLGYFKTAEEAHVAYRRAAIEEYGEFTHDSIKEAEQQESPPDLR